MKKFYSLALSLSVAAIASAETFTTPDAGTTYTLKSLSQIEGSNLTLKEGKTYLLSDGLTISAGDKLQLLAGDVLEIANNVAVTVYGEAIFNPESTAYIKRASDDAEPTGFAFHGKTTLKNINYEGGNIQYFGSDPLIVDKCDFHDVSNSKSNYGVIVVGGGLSKGNKITNCTFTDCKPGAINTPANLGVGMLFENNVITNVSTLNLLCPYVNLSASATDSVIIRNNTLNGAKLVKPGGIGVSNMLNTPGKNIVVVSGNLVQNCSWGLNFVGGMDVTISDNVIKDNCWDTDDNGGIAVTMYSLPSYPLTVYAHDNTFEGNKWGPCNVGGSIANYGKTETDENGISNPGNNILRNNQHEVAATGQIVKCDFCNNSTVTAYAQNNYWGSAADASEAAQYIGDTNSDSRYGTVIYEPVKDASGVKAIMPDFDNKFEGNVELYRLDGVKVFSGEASRISEAGEGIYVICQGNKTHKIIIK